MRVGLIGTGKWGRHLARNFYEMGVLSALCDLSTKALFLDVPWCQDASLLFQNKSITQIAIATPPATHYFSLENCKSYFHTILYFKIASL